MKATLENLTTNEAAMAAGVTVADINRAIDPAEEALFHHREPDDSQGRLPVDRFLF